MKLDMIGFAKAAISDWRFGLFVLVWMGLCFTVGWYVGRGLLALPSVFRRRRRSEK